MTTNRHKIRLLNVKIFKMEDDYLTLSKNIHCY